MTTIEFVDAAESEKVTVVFLNGRLASVEDRTETVVDDPWPLFQSISQTFEQFYGTPTASTSMGEEGGELSSTEKAIIKLHGPSALRSWHILDTEVELAMNHNTATSVTIFTFTYRGPELLALRRVMPPANR